MSSTREATTQLRGSGHSGVRIPLPPVFARVVEESEDCRAEALAKADLFDIVNANAASYDSASRGASMARFFYIYLLQSERHENRFYTGLTNDLRKRLKDHNAGRIHHTAKWRPWWLKAYVALSDRSRAVQFERYLKSASGRAFTKRHL
jgi:putative endonuclease